MSSIQAFAYALMLLGSPLLIGMSFADGANAGHAPAGAALIIAGVSFTTRFA